MMFTIKTSETDLCFDLVKIYLSGVKKKPVTLPHAESPALLIFISKLFCRNVSSVPDIIAGC